MNSEINTAIHLVDETKGQSVGLDYLGEKFIFNVTKEVVNFNDVRSYKLNTQHSIDNAVKIGLYMFALTGVIAWMYETSLGSETPAILFGFVVTGSIWGVVAFIVATFFKRDQYILTVKTIDKSFSLLISRIDSDRLLSAINMKQEQKSSINSDTILLNSPIDTISNNMKIMSQEKFDELVRLKALLDQQVISDIEFKSLKEELLGNRED